MMSESAKRDQLLTKVVIAEHRATHVQFVQDGDHLLAFGKSAH